MILLKVGENKHKYVDCIQLVSLLLYRLGESLSLLKGAKLVHRRGHCTVYPLEEEVVFVI